jgi:hypothetical protein
MPEGDVTDAVGITVSKLILTLEALTLFPAASFKVAAKVTAPSVNVEKFKVVVQLGESAVLQVGVALTEVAPESVAVTVKVRMSSEQDPERVTEAFVGFPT